MDKLSDSFKRIFTSEEEEPEEDVICMDMDPDVEVVCVDLDGAGEE